MRYKCVVAYKGNNYAGFQSQINGLAIQDVIEEKLAVIIREPVKIVMSSRTDAGVHALGQVFHFDSAKELNLYKFKHSINCLLPHDIHVHTIEKVDEDFHARFNVLGKQYVYLINCGEYNVFYDGFAYQCPFPLDVDLMKQATKLFLGEHNFEAFNTSPLDLYPNQVRTIYRFDLIEQGDVLRFEIVGDGFLRNMVRIIVGTLVDLGRGKKTVDDIEKMFSEPRKDERRNNIDPNGLYLKEVYYDALPCDSQQ